ncbi:MAG TPA: phosphate ABC transporter permease PstA [Salinivirgaceae bacterium]|nr:phosphate ABC transporter permease PstA [Salinivirgaceae bacterium]
MKIDFNKRRLIKDKLFLWFVIVFSVIIALPLVIIIGTVLIKGIGQINLDFFIKTTPTTLEAMMANSVGERVPGGIANGIVGMFLTVLMASIVAIPVGIMCGVYLSENKNKRLAGVVRFISELLQGTPSIVIGIIAYLWIVIPMGTFSAIAGAVSLAIMMLPLIIRSTEETLNLLPVSLKEAALSLGTSYSSMIFKVWLPSAFSGIFTGILLSISRIMGETAPLMLTILGSSYIQWDITKPNTSVSLLIWEFYNDPNLQSMIWSASLFLLAAVLILNISAKSMAKKWSPVF